MAEHGEEYWVTSNFLVETVGGMWYHLQRQGTWLEERIIDHDSFLNLLSLNFLLIYTFFFRKLARWVSSGVSPFIILYFSPTFQRIGFISRIDTIFYAL